MTPLSNGSQRVRDREGAPLHARQPYLFRFGLEDSTSHAAPDMQVYMDIPGQSAFVSVERSVFAFEHPRAGCIVTGSFDVKVEN